MQVLGLTGGIGSGKSSVAAIFAQLGATIIDADQLARQAVAPGSPGLKAIEQRFGTQFILSDGQLDRRALGLQVFQDEAARKDLNQIVHPEVSRLAMEAMAAAQQAGAPLVVYDVPLLYENGLDKTMPQVAVVSVSAETQRARVRGRDDLSEQEIEDRIASQLPLSEKVSRADYVIDNNQDLEYTRQQVEALYQRLLGEPKP